MVNFSQGSSDVDTVKIGKGKSLQDAFDNAVAQLPKHGMGTADGFAIFTIQESGQVIGGIAGLKHYFAKVQVLFSEHEPSV